VRFLCVCLSPAIDATVRLDAWPSDGCIIKDAVDTFAPGGKGLNVARWLAVRSLAETNGRQAEGVRRDLAQHRIACGGLLGADNAAGCWFNGAFFPAPKVKVLDTTAAGDTLLAEWCFSGDPRRAVASGSAACTMPGGEPPSLSLVESLVEADGP
jgi:sugar/nucleoside kinase (ribokinase family)